MSFLRDYQRKGINVIREAWDLNKRPMVVVATGGGKTVMIAQLLVECVTYTERALIIAHTEEIVKQIQGTVETQYGVGVGVVMGKNDDTDGQIIVATRQSLSPARLSRILDYGKFRVVVVDEAHHATSENTYGKIIRKIQRNSSETKFVGFTATPVKNTIFENVFSWSILDGVKSGFLVPTRQVQVKTAVDISNLQTGADGDYITETLVSILECKNWVELALRAYTTFILPTNRPCLAFFPSVKMSRRFAKALQKNGYSAAHIDGSTQRDERERTLSEYKNGDIQIVCNVEVLTEGFDAPNTSAILLARPTRSKTLLTQILGRGLRIACDKKDCLFVNLSAEDTETFALDDILGYSSRIL